MLHLQTTTQNNLSIFLGNTLNDQINTLKSLRRTFVDCMIVASNDELGLEKTSMQQLQVMYYLCDSKIEQLTAQF